MDEFFDLTGFAPFPDGHPNRTFRSEGIQVEHGPASQPCKKLKVRLFILALYYLSASAELPIPFADDITPLLEPITTCSHSLQNPMQLDPRADDAHVKAWLHSFRC